MIQNLSSTTTELLIPVSEAARRLGIGISTCWELVRAGTVETVTLSRRRLVVVESLIRLVEERRAAPDEPIRTPPVGRGRPPKYHKSATNPAEAA
jgi:hypothetical protein